MVDNPVWDIFGIECKDEWEQESGEIVYNKRKHWEYPPLSPLRIPAFLIHFFSSPSPASHVFRARLSLVSLHDFASENHLESKADKQRLNASKLLLPKFRSLFPTPKRR